MIIKELYRQREDGVNLYINYSDNGHRIKQIETGRIYDNAIDVENAPYTYEETDIKIEDNATEEDYLNTLEKLGVTNE